MASGLELLVLDEADLLLSFGYEEDIKKKVVDACEKGVQCMLLSATAGEELARLESLVLQHPVRLDVSARPEILSAPAPATTKRRTAVPTSRTACWTCGPKTSSCAMHGLAPTGRVSA